MSIYVRTALGNEAALNHASALPRKLRTLLIAIDGTTSKSTYVNSLSSFGDVSALLDSLLQANLIKVAGDERAASASQGRTLARSGPETTWSDTETGQKAFNPRQDIAANLNAAPLFPDPPSSKNGFQQSLPARNTAAGNGAFASSPASGRSLNTADYQLRNAIALMSDFVTEHMPADCFEIVLALEGLGSVEQVLFSLSGYEAMISPVGGPARQHLAELRKLLSSL